MTELQKVGEMEQHGIREKNGLGKLNNLGNRHGCSTNNCRNTPGQYNICESAEKEL